MFRDVQSHLKRAFPASDGYGPATRRRSGPGPFRWRGKRTDFGRPRFVVLAPGETYTTPWIQLRDPNAKRLTRAMSDEAMGALNAALDAVTPDSFKPPYPSWRDHPLARRR